VSRVEASRFPATAAVALRPAVAEDREFLVGLYGSTRDVELSQVAWAPGQREAFVRMQFDAQDRDYRARNPQASFDVVEVGGAPAGRLIVDRRDGEIRILDISLLPEVRGAGIGTGLIRKVQDEAASTGRPLTVHVETHNPAVTLYARLGFEPVSQQASEVGVYRLMRWRAP
jgi:ribosomal protein S18 acetylase RimI-like enzyme